MGDEQKPAEPRRRGTRVWGAVIVVGAVVAGFAAYHIIPGLALGAALRPIIGSPTGWSSILPVLLSLIVVVLAVAALFGLVLTIRNWVVSRKADTPTAEPAFAKIGRMGTLVVSILVLVVVALLVLFTVMVATQAQQNPGAGIGYLAVSLLAVTVLPALGVPLLIFQIVWTWRPAVSRWEHTALISNRGGKRQSILTARIVAMIVWVPLTAVVIFSAVGVIYAYTPAKQQADQQSADSFVYNESIVEGALRNQLLDGNYLIDNLKCPKMIPTPSVSGNFTCTVNSNGHARTLHVTWASQPYELGHATATNPTADGITSLTDLGQSPPTNLVPPDREYSNTEVAAAVKTELVKAGWDPNSTLLTELTCPGIGPGYVGGVRCTLDGVYLDVYYTGPSTFTVMTAEVNYLKGK